MAKDEKKEEGAEGEESSGGGSMLPTILGGLSVLLNIAILVYLILFPAGGDNSAMDTLTANLEEMSNDQLPSMDEKISALTALLPSDDEEMEDGEEGMMEDDEPANELAEITMMLTDTQLIMRQLAENLNSDTATIRKSVGGAAQAGKQVRNLRHDLKRIEKKLDDMLDGKKKRKSGTLSSSIFDYQSEGITYP